MGSGIAPRDHVPLCFQPLNDPDRIVPLQEPDEHHLWRALAWGVGLAIPWYLALGIIVALATGRL
jgi:hypothetical protein